MKKVLIPLMFLFFVIGCNEEKLNQLDSINQDIYSAQAWYDRQFVNLHSAKTNTPDNNRNKSLKPHWEKNKKRKLDSQYDILIVETDGYQLKNSNLDC